MAEPTKEVIPEGVRMAEGAALRKLIDASEFNQQTLAARSGVGSKGFLWQVVSGHRPLNLDAAIRLAKALQVRIDAFSPRLAAVVREASTLVLLANRICESVGGASTNEPIPITRITDSAIARSPWPFTGLTPSEYELISPASRAEIDAIVKGMYIEASKRGNTMGG